MLDNFFHIVFFSTLIMFLLLFHSNGWMKAGQLLPPIYGNSKSRISMGLYIKTAPSNSLHTCIFQNPGQMLSHGEASQS